MPMFNELICDKGNLDVKRTGFERNMNLSPEKSNLSLREDSGRIPGFLDLNTKEKMQGILKEYHPMAEALKAMIPDKDVEIQHKKDQIIFKPLNQNVSKALLFFHGCKVDKRAYAPMAKELARNGYLVVIGDIDLKNAVGSAPRKIFNEHKGIKDWYVGGHSLGGCLATEVAFMNQDVVRGAIMFGSFPIPFFRRTKIKFLDIRASNDKILYPSVADTAFKMNVHEKNIERVDILGGNHGNFGYYGEQAADGRAEISREDQQKIVLDKTLEFTKIDWVNQYD